MRPVLADELKCRTWQDARVCSQMTKLCTFSLYGLGEAGSKHVAGRSVGTYRAIVSTEGELTRHDGVQQSTVRGGRAGDCAYRLIVARSAHEFRPVAHCLNALFPLEQEGKQLDAHGQSPQERCRVGAVVLRFDARASAPTRRGRPKSRRLSGARAQPGRIEYQDLCRGRSLSQPVVLTPDRRPSFRHQRRIHAHRRIGAALRNCRQRLRRRCIDGRNRSIGRPSCHPASQQPPGLRCL